eukprot:COSAG06_NODE_2538_length_6707_cov_7.401937_4_plen_332_part_00
MPYSDCRTACRWATAMLGTVLWMAVALAQAVALPIEIFVDPERGMDTSVSFTQAAAGTPLRTLAAAQAAVRRALQDGDADADIVVQLHPGRHVVRDGPLRLQPLDGGGGRNRVVTWRSLDPLAPAVVDGGVQVTGWKPHPSVKGALVAPLPSPIPHGTILRQLWVNGVRATRPVLYAVNLDGRSPGGLNVSAGLPSTPCCPQPCRNAEPPHYPCPTCNCTVMNTSTGYDFSQSHVDPSTWHNPTDIEFVFHFPGQWTPWIEPRCMVSNVSGSHVAVAEPCWGDLKERNFGPSKKQMRALPPPAAIENVLSNFTVSSRATVGARDFQSRSSA